MEKQKISIIIPTLNEEKTIGKVILFIPKKYRKNVIVADCNSDDRTVEIAKRLKAKVVISQKRNYDYPCFLGAREALKDGSNIIVFLHAGGDDEPSEIPLLIDPIVSGKADLVMGTRYKDDLKTKSLMFHQKIGTRFVIGIINIFFKRNFTDIGPYRAIRTDTYNALKLIPPGFSYPSQMLVKSLRKGYRVKEIPVTSRPRIGKSKISGSIVKSIKAGFNMIWALWFIFG